VAAAAGASCGCCFWDSGDCESTTEVALPVPRANVSQSVTLEFARSRDGRPAFSCTFDSSTEGFPWRCVPKPRSTVHSGAFVLVRYSFEPATWFIHATGPGGTSNFELKATVAEAHEGSMVGCVNDCSSATMAVAGSELAAVGVELAPPPEPPPPTFGAPCTEHSECDSSLLCGPIGALTTFCTRGCALEAPCPIGSTCDSSRYCSQP
jgi:hypothetical protein